MCPPDGVAELFMIESGRLAGAVEAAASRELSVAEIAETYHLVMNVSAMITALGGRDAAAGPGPLQERIAEAGKAIDGFNAAAHPRILAGLAASVEEAAEALRAGSDPGTPPGGDGGTADAYEELRQMMSAREFVEQYDSGLAGDP